MGSTLFHAPGPALLRAARLPALRRDWPDLDKAPCEVLRSWIAKQWSGAESDAVRVASPSLSTSLDDIVTGRCASERDLRRAAMSLARYLIRARSRSTPFGLFAGTTPMHFTDTASVQWSEQDRVVERAAPERVAEVIDAVHANPEAVARLRVVANNLVFAQGSLYILPWGEQRTEITRTDPLEAVLGWARAAIAGQELADRLCSRFPNADRPGALGLVGELLRRGFLLSEAQAPATEPEALTHLMGRLEQAGTPDDNGVLARIREAHADPDLLGGALRRDLHLDCDATLPWEVGDEVAAAVSAMARLSTTVDGEPGWKDYYQAFVHRYGAATLVPLDELLDPGMGLGYPATYPGSVMPPPRRSSPRQEERQAKLLALAQRAAMLNHREVVLNEEDLSELAVSDLSPGHVPPHLEAAVTVCADHPADIDAGRYLLRLRMARSIGTMSGRFLTPGCDISALAAQMPTITHGAVPAQLSFPPLNTSADQVTRTPRLLEHVLPLAEHRPADEPGVMDVNELSVMADRTRLYLVHTPTRRIIEPQMPHGLSLDSQTPALARFLTQLPRGFCAGIKQFPWGESGLELPFLPRIRYRRTILSPARWILTAPALDPGREWEAALGQWRARWGVPAVVGLAQGDRVLSLNLDEAGHRALLREHLRHRERALLTEVCDPETDLGWIGHRAHEIVVPLTRRGAPSPSPLGQRSPVRVRAREWGELPTGPGARWVFAKVFVHPRRQDEVLIRHLPSLLEELGHPSWWFLRYREGSKEADHLRLRLRASSTERAAEIMAALGAWGERLRHARLCPRLVLDTYLPEVGRYGTGPCLEAAEEVFAAESALVLDRLSCGGFSPVMAETAALMVHTVQVFTGGTGWLLERREDARAERPPGHVQDVAAELAARPVDPAMAQALKGYRALLDEHGGPEADAVCSSLLHMLHNRLSGIDRNTERTCYRVARQVALTWHYREKARS